MGQSQICISTFDCMKVHARTKRIAAGTAKGMPIDNRKAQMVPHRFAGDDFVGAVMLYASGFFERGPS
jgi:hypothetical protein